MTMLLNKVIANVRLSSSRVSDNFGQFSKRLWCFADRASAHLRTGRPPTVCDDTRCCTIQFLSSDDEHNNVRNM